jgi:hypothetical protein
VRLVALLASLFSLCLASCPGKQARAQPRAAPALNFVRAPGAERCIDPAALTRRVEELTGPVFVPSSATTFVMEVEIAPLGAGFRAVIAVAGGGVERHTRVLEEASADCHKLDAPLVFVLALTIDPRLSLSGLPAELQGMFGQEQAPEEALLAELDQAPRVDAEPPPALGSELESAPAKAPSAPARPRHYVVGAGAALSLYTLPDAAWGFDLRLASDVARWFWLSLSLHAHPFSQVQTLNDGSRLALRSYGLALLACPLYGKLGSVFAQACAGPTLELISGHGGGYEQNHWAQLWIPSLAAALAVRLPLFWQAGLSVEVQGRVGLTPGRFVSKSTNEGTVGHTAPGRFGLALVFGAYVEF